MNAIADLEASGVRSIDVLLQHRKWTREGALEAFAWITAAELMGVMAEDATALQRLEDAIIRHEILDQWALQARDLGIEASAVFYAAEVGLVRWSDRSPTEAARIFLDLGGQDAAEFLFHLESIRSTGIEDEWRIHPDLAQMLLEHPHAVFTVEARYGV